jgi:hypothetical protein
MVLISTLGALDYFILKHVNCVVVCISIQWLLCQMKLAGCMPNITKRLFVFQWQKNISKLASNTGSLGLKTPGMYCLLCECSEVYIGKTAITMGTRSREHLKPLHLSQRGSSLWYSIILIRDKKLQEKAHTHTLDKATGHMHHLSKEVLKTQLQPSNYNNDGVLC